MKLRVLASFRDISNFAIRHEVGDEIEVSDPDRISRLVNGGLCEAVGEPLESNEATDSQPEAAKRQETAPAAEAAPKTAAKPKTAKTSKKK